MNWGEFQDEVLARLHDTGLASNLPGWYNDIQAQVDARSQWRHLDTRMIQPTSAPYTTGTVTLTVGSATVLGSGAAFPSDCAGQIIQFQSEGSYYYILTRDSDSQLTLASVYIGAGGAGKTYGIYYYQQDKPTDLSLQRLYHVTLQDGLGPHYKLRYVTEDALFDTAPNEILLKTRPWRFRFFGSKMQLWPPPNAKYNVNWFYCRNPVTMGASDPRSTSLDWPIEAQWTILQGVWALGLLFIDDSQYAKVQQSFMSRLEQVVADNNRIPGSELYMRRWDEVRGTYPRPPIYPTNIG